MPGFFVRVGRARPLGTAGIGGAIPQLPFVVLAPAAHRAVGEQRARVIPAGGHVLDAGQVGGADGHDTLIGRAVTELSLGVAPPAADRAILEQRTDVRVADGKVDDSIETGYRLGQPPGRLAFGQSTRAGHGAFLVGRADRLVGRFTGDITPAGGGAIGQDSAAGIRSRPNRGHAGNADDRNGHRAVLVPIVPQLAVVIATPTAHHAVRERHTGVVVTGGDGDRAREADHGGRFRAVGRRAIAQLTLIVPPPAADRAFLQQRAGVVSARSERGHARQVRHLHQGSAPARVPSTQLPLVAMAPTPDGAIHEADAGVVVADGEVSDPRAAVCVRNGRLSLTPAGSCRHEERDHDRHGHGTTRRVHRCTSLGSCAARLASGSARSPRPGHGPCVIASRWRGACSQVRW